MTSTTAQLTSSKPVQSPAGHADRGIVADTGLWLFLTAPLSFVLVLAIAIYLSHLSF